MSEKADTELSELWVPEDTADFISSGRSEDDSHLAALTERACCCPSRPAVRVLVPVTGHAGGPVDLLLCGHHYRASRDALIRTRASVSYVGDGLS
jgi:hypothetical protein